MHISYFLYSTAYDQEKYINYDLDSFTEIKVKFNIEQYMIMDKCDLEWKKREAIPEL